jgi:hypothetical protein
MSRIRTHAQFLAAHARWEEPEDDGPLTECADCGGDGCECCNFKGYFLGDLPMSGREYEQLAEDRH